MQLLVVMGIELQVSLTLSSLLREIKILREVHLHKLHSVVCVTSYVTTAGGVTNGGGRINSQEKQCRIHRLAVVWVQEGGR